MTAIRPVFYVSDGTGITAETVGHSLLTQFNGFSFVTDRMSFVDDTDKAHEAAARISDLIAANAGRRVIVLDPNIRLSLISDLAAYRLRLHDWLRHSDLLKLSDEDVEALKPGCAHAAAADQWLAAGPRAVVITSGGEGAVLYRRGQAPLPIAAPRIELADTIGAGDTFTAGLSVALLEHGVQDSAALERLDNAVWLDVLRFAATAAALNCTREGANPPTLAEVQSALAAR